MENQEHPVYTVAEVAAMLRLSRPTITRLFEKESGVIMLSRPETMHKRRRRMIRIPHAVYLRVRAKLMPGSQ